MYIIETRQLGSEQESARKDKLQKITCTYVL